MARMRSVKPEFWLDPKTTRMSRDARLLYIALWNQADEHGRLFGDPRVIKGAAFPYDDDLTAAVIDGLLTEIEGHGKLIRYVVEGADYIYLPKLAKHQRLEPGKVDSRLPGPPAEPGDNSSERRADEPERDATSSETIVAKHVAGSRWHVAGGGAAPTAPAPRCAAHTERPTAIPCRACGDARRAYEAWQQQQRDRPTAVPRPTDARCPVEGHQHHTAVNCPACRSERIAAS